MAAALARLRCQWLASSPAIITRRLCANNSAWLAKRLPKIAAPSPSSSSFAQPPIVEAFVATLRTTNLRVALGVGFGAALYHHAYLSAASPPLSVCEASAPAAAILEGTPLPTLAPRRHSSGASEPEASAPPQPRSSSSILAAWLDRIRRAVRSCGRIVWICLVFTPVMATLPLRWWGGARGEEVWWGLCVRAFERSGALLIKLAQWSSSRPDLFGAVACARFAHLQDHAIPHAWADTERTLERAFGKLWREELQLEREPIGSGCIAQVYRGQLRSRNPDASGDGGGDGNGNNAWVPVAVKVLHPNVRSDIHGDMDLLRALGMALGWMPRLRWLNPTGMLNEFAKLLTMQLDLELEAANLEKFRENFPPVDASSSRGETKSSGGPRIVFPEPMRPYVTADVLVESFVEGQPFLKWATTCQPSQDERAKICQTGVDVVVKMLFVDNFVHGDLHPGNIFVTARGELAFLDAGIAVRYTEAEHEHLIDVLTAFIQYDGYKGGMLMAERAAASALGSGDGGGGGGAADGGAAGQVDLHGFCTKIQQMVYMARDEPGFFDKIGEFITIICDAACDHRVKLQAGFISVALSVKVVEGSVLQVDPLCVVAPRAKAVVLREHMRRKGAALLGGRPGGGGGGASNTKDATAALAASSEEARRLEEELEAKDRALRAAHQRMVDERAAAAAASKGASPASGGAAAAAG